MSSKSFSAQDAIVYNALRFTVTSDEYKALHESLIKRLPSAVKRHAPQPSRYREYVQGGNEYFATSVRYSSRLFLATQSGLTLWVLISRHLIRRGKPSRQVFLYQENHLQLIPLQTLAQSPLHQVTQLPPLPLPLHHPLPPPHAPPLLRPPARDPAVARRHALPTAQPAHLQPAPRAAHARYGGKLGRLRPGPVSRRTASLDGRHLRRDASRRVCVQRPGSGWVAARDAGVVWELDADAVGIWTVAVCVGFGAGLLSQGEYPILSVKTRWVFSSFLAHLFVKLGRPMEISISIGVHDMSRDDRCSIRHRSSGPSTTTCLRAWRT